MKSFLVMAVMFSSIVFYGQNYNNRKVIGEENAKLAVENALNDKDYKPFYDTLIKEKETAISVAESILFNMYGRATITSERPYECYLIDGYWFISGTLPKKYENGGVFEIIISAKDGRVIKLAHGK
jgi:NTF2 fold immunity protein